MKITLSYEELKNALVTAINQSHDYTLGTAAHRTTQNAHAISCHGSTSR